MRLPNGFGNVSKLPGNRRKPYRARVTVGWLADDTGKQHQQYKTIGYYASREEGLIALCNYHQNPAKPSPQLSFSKVYDLWSKEHYSKISKSNERGYTSAFKLCEPLHDFTFSNIRLIHLQQIIDHLNKNYPVLRRIKILYSQLYKYAMQNDICEKDYSKYVDVSQYKNRNPNAYKREPFSEEEIALLWEISPRDIRASFILMMIYSGCRIGELLNLKKKDICLEHRYFYIKHAKTSSGIRYVPIADKVYPFWEKWYEKDDGIYLFSDQNQSPLKYHSFYGAFWKPLMAELKLEHLPHDTRHTCITMLTMAQISDKIIRKIVGHKGQNVTEIVYTHFEIKELQDAINQI